MLRCASALLAVGVAALGMAGCFYLAMFLNQVRVRACVYVCVCGSVLAWYLCGEGGGARMCVGGCRGDWSPIIPGVIIKLQAGVQGSSLQDQE